MPMQMLSKKRALDKIYKRRDRYEIADWQREEVWDNAKKQALIDSVLRNWKLPKFYFFKVSDNPRRRMKSLMGNSDSRPFSSSLTTSFSYLPPRSELRSTVNCTRTCQAQFRIRSTILKSNMMRFRMRRKRN